MLTRTHSSASAEAWAAAFSIHSRPAAAVSSSTIALAGWRASAAKVKSTPPNMSTVTITKPRSLPEVFLAPADRRHDGKGFTRVSFSAPLPRL